MVAKETSDGFGLWGALKKKWIYLGSEMLPLPGMPVTKGIEYAPKTKMIMEKQPYWRALHFLVRVSWLKPPCSTGMGYETVTRRGISLSRIIPPTIHPGTTFWRSKIISETFHHFHHLSSANKTPSNNLQGQRYVLQGHELPGSSFGRWRLIDFLGKKMQPGALQKGER